MYVIKRNGQKEPVAFDKITTRLLRLCQQTPALTPAVDPTIICQKVVQGVYCGVKTTELDNLAAETAAHMITTHPEYGQLAARIAISNLHRETSPDFALTVEREFHFISKITGQPSPLVSAELFHLVQKYRDVLNDLIDYSRDFNYDFFGFKTLERAYLIRLNDQVIERPQHLLMRVSLGIHGDDIESVKKTYLLLSQGWFTHATPTLFNAGTPFPQMSSCFLLMMQEDSIHGIYDTLKQCALISKSAGGIGLAIHNIRATHSHIKGTNGISNGIVPMLRVFNNTARYVDQGGGKRKGAISIYLEPWHADILDWLELRRNHGAEEQRARDLFYSLWIPDLFMRRVENNESWSLFCPAEAPDLHEYWGIEFEKRYTQYELEGRARSVIKAQDLWFAIINAQIETGTPCMLYKDACNSKSNQQNLGTIKSSNLCTEIIQYTSPEEIAVCNLASINLSKFVVSSIEKCGDHELLSKEYSILQPREVGPIDLELCFDHAKLFEIAYQVVFNLNKIIDRNYYPVPQARTSNMRHRPIGIGVQGLADVFLMMQFEFGSPQSKQLNRQIFETLYFASMSASKDLAKRDGPYETYQGSPVSKGIFQYDMWQVTPSPLWNWNELKSQVSIYGVRNSLLVAPMPTASTSQILGNNECFEPYTSNIYTRRVLAGEFTVINEHLVRNLMGLGLWNDKCKNEIISRGGSVQGIRSIPQYIQTLYKTVWELKQRTLIDMAADRGAFIDQSQSFNVFIAMPTHAKLTSMHFYAWKKGLKTGMYYLRTRPAANAIQFTVDQQSLQSENANEEISSPSTRASQPSKDKLILNNPNEICRMEPDCMVCGS